jgi:hypothetical protein
VQVKKEASTGYGFAYRNRIGVIDKQLDSWTSSLYHLTGFLALLDQLLIKLQQEQSLILNVREKIVVTN